MRKLRKTRTKKRREETKKLQEELKTQTSLMMKHPKECCICQLKFDRTPETVVEWKIVVREERVRLTCPSCWDTIQEEIGKIK